ncbi:hypothetical protein F5X99DRAFT_378570 [Biscogniauxia marginata]|nr:hypothetical protein F5X99DRAFT_378570 [Biscogniauxia marginata]
MCDELEVLRIENEKLREEINGFLCGNTKQPEEEVSDVKEALKAKEPVLSKDILNLSGAALKKRAKDITIDDNFGEQDLRIASHVLKKVTWALEREVEQLKSRVWVLTEEVKQETSEKKIYENAFYHLTKRLRHVHDEQEKRRITSQALHKAKKALQDRVKGLEGKGKEKEDIWPPPFVLGKNPVGGPSVQQGESSSSATAAANCAAIAARVSAMSSFSPPPRTNGLLVAPGHPRSEPSSKRFLAADAAKSRQRSQELEEANAATLKVNNSELISESFLASPRSRI